MSHYPHPLLAREGWPFIGLAVVLSLLATMLWGGVAALPFYIVLVFVLQFFRDPPRMIPQKPNAVLSPADGRIVVVEKAHDPYANREALKISVFMNVFNVHVNRSPIKGVVKDIVYKKGQFLNASLDKASDKNERSSLVINTDNGTKIIVVQIAGLIARRILGFISANHNLEQGERFGLIRFGSRVDIYMPLDAVTQCIIGDTVIAGESVLASLN